MKKPPEKKRDEWKPRGDKQTCPDTKMPEGHRGLHEFLACNAELRHAATSVTATPDKGKSLG